MLYAYPDTTITENAGIDTTRMFVFATMYGDKLKADSLLQIIKPTYPTAKAIASNIYQGACISPIRTKLWLYEI